MNIKLNQQAVQGLQPNKFRISALLDVKLTALANNETLVWSASQNAWINSSVGGIGVASLNGLSGNLNLVAGTNIDSIVPSGTNITINASTQTTTLTSTQVAWGSAGNAVTSSRNITFLDATSRLIVGQPGTSIGILALSSSGGLGGATITTNAGATQMLFKNFSGNTVVTMDNSLNTILAGTLQEIMGADITASSTITFNAGNYNNITGNTTINLWESAGLQNGTCKTVRFTGKGTIKHNQTASGTAFPLLLNSSTDLVTDNKNTKLIMRLNVPISAWEQIGTVSSDGNAGSGVSLQYSLNAYSGGVTNIPSASVTQAQMATMTQNRLLGRYTGSANTVDEIQIGTGLALSGAGVLTSTGAIATVSNSDGTLTISPTTGSVVASLASNVPLAHTWTGVNIYTPTARSSGVASYFVINTPADTGITANTEAIGINHNTNTRTWVDGTIAVQREFLFQAPTYAKTTTSVTFTKSGTLVITGAPISGTGVTQTNPYALWVQSGNSHFGSVLGGSPLAPTLGTGVEIAESNNTDGGEILSVTNISNGTSAYSGVNLNNDLANGSTYTHFAGMYYSSSTYNTTAFGTAFAVANQLAIQNTDGPLTLSAQGASQYVNIIIAGTASTNEVGRFTTTGLTLGLTGTLSGQLSLKGSTSGTAILTVPVAAGTPTITLPTVTGTLATLAGTESLSNKTLVAPILGTPTSGNLSNCTNYPNVTQSVAGLVASAGQLLGTNTNDNASAGNIGEVFQNSTLRSSPTALTTVTPVNIASITLTAGDWDIGFSAGATAGTGTILANYLYSVSKISATLPATDTTGVPTSGEIRMAIPPVSGTLATSGNFALPGIPIRASISGSTTFYLVVQASFSVSTLSAYGSIWARRVR